MANNIVFVDMLTGLVLDHGVLFGHACALKKTHLKDGNKTFDDWHKTICTTIMVALM